MNDALVTAQQLRGDIRQQAEREAQLILREAHNEAERIMDDSRHQLRSLASEIDALDRTRRQYLAQMRILVERQLAELDAVQGAGPPQRPTPASLPALSAPAAQSAPVSVSAPLPGGMTTPAFLAATDEP